MYFLIRPLGHGEIISLDAWKAHFYGGMEANPPPNVWNKSDFANLIHPILGSDIHLALIPSPSIVSGMTDGWQEGVAGS
jgi:hypothetical protein